MGKLVHLLGAILLVPAMAQAQSAIPTAEAGSKPVDKAAAAEKPETAAPKAEAHGPPSDVPSRYLGADIGEQVEALASLFAIRSRTTDPFCLVQDPSAAPKEPKKPVRSSVIPSAAIPATPYHEIVAQIRVTTVIPGEGRFLVGTRSFVRGDRFPLSYRTRNYPSEVVEVKRDKIVLRNVETSETGELRLDMMPDGMSKGTRGLLAPGMQAPRADAPLEIESEASAPPSAADPRPGGLTN